MAGNSSCLRWPKELTPKPATSLTPRMLNNASATPNNLLIILNDNNMAIDRSVGAVSYTHLWADFNDLDTHHYPTYLTGVARFTNGYKVFMPTEFMHAMYDQGGGAGLCDFWDRWCTCLLYTSRCV